MYIRNGDLDNKKTFFDWDAGNIEKCQKHGVTIEEIEYVLTNDPTIVPDPFPGEIGLRAVGQNNVGRNVFVVFAPRMFGEVLKLRPISARYMHRGEVGKYFNN